MSTSPLRSITAWLLWALLLTGWTVALLSPQPERDEEPVKGAVRFIVAKNVHVGAYTVLTGLLVWLPISAGRTFRQLSWRWALVGLLSFHAGITEYLQNFVPGRTGTFRDVVLNHAGIALGLALTRKWWGEVAPFEIPSLSLSFWKASAPAQALDPAPSPPPSRAAAPDSATPPATEAAPAQTG